MSRIGELVEDRRMRYIMRMAQLLDIISQSLGIT